MKQCTKCKCEKELDEFYKNSNRKDGVSSYCKCCQKAHKKIHYANNKERYKECGLRAKKWFMDYKRELQCNRCGFNHPAALDFHHKDPKTKTFSMSGVHMGKINKDKIMEEISKCEVLCSNCHRIEHAFNY